MPEVKKTNTLMERLIFQQAWAQKRNILIQNPFSIGMRLKNKDSNWQNQSGPKKITHSSLKKGTAPFSTMPETKKTNAIIEKSTYNRPEPKKNKYSHWKINFQ